MFETYQKSIPFLLSGEVKNVSSFLKWEFAKMKGGQAESLKWGKYVKNIYFILYDLSFTFDSIFEYFLENMKTLSYNSQTLQVVII